MEIMSERLGEANMIGLGKNRKSGALCVILIIFLHPIILKAQDYYYVNSYELHSDLISAKLAKINLSIKTVESEGEANIAGQIMIRKPILIRRNRSTYYMVPAVNMGPCKNCQYNNDSITTNFAIFDSDAIFYFSGALSNISIFDYINYRSDSAFINYTDFSGEITLKKKAALALQDRRLIIQERNRFPFDETIPDSLGRFTNIHPIYYNVNSPYFWTLISDGLYLLSYDYSGRSLLDSLKISANLDHSYIFGLIPGDSLIYIFYLNYNILGGPALLQKTNVDPSYAKILNTGNFSLIDSFEIAIPPLDSGYTAAENGSCDNVGPYLVYYFFTGEDYRYFSPAMLFIFDTRTNEATWLRVGWR